MHPNCKLLFEKYACHLFHPGLRVLEIAPDAYPSTLRKMVSFQDIRWDTLNIDDSPATYSRCELYSYPIPNDAYDIVVSANVSEHVAKIWRWMPELARVTKPGGLVITHNPTSWARHECPIDCWRIYPEGMKALCEDAGLAIETLFHGSLEHPQYKRAWPGISPEWQSRNRRIWFRFWALFGLPVEKAFDLIAVARKPIPSGGSEKGHRSAHPAPQAA
jgi:SAM-dependent methyltransferase